MTADATVATPNLAADCSLWKRVRIASWNWLIRPDVCVELQPKLPLLQQRDYPAAEATVIKQGPHRTVCRWEPVSGEFYLKQFHQPDLRTRLRHWLRRSQAHWELSRHQRAQQRGIPTTEVVAIGHAAAWGGESALITRGIPNVTPLNEWLRERTATLELRDRRTLAEQLGRLIATMHRRGVIHHDLHAGNVLLRPEPDGWRFWVVDLSAMRFQSAPASWPDVGNQLGRLLYSLLPYLHGTDQTAFFRAYGQTFQQEHSRRQPKRPQILRDVASRCDQFARDGYKQSDRKWRKGTRKIFVLNTPSLHFRGLASLGNDRLQKLCQSATDDPAIAVHVLRQSDPWEASGKFGWARHCWETGHALQRRIIPSLVPICLWEPRGPEGLAESFAVLREPSWTALAAHISAMSDAEVFAVGERVINLLRRFHQQGFSHRRLGIDAFEVQFGAKPAVRLVCLGDVCQRTTTPRQRLEELASLVSDVVSRQMVTRSTRLRWLRRYLGRCASATWKADWRLISRFLSATSQRCAA